MKNQIVTGRRRAAVPIQLTNRKRTDWVRIAEQWFWVVASAGLLILLFTSPGLRIRSVQVTGAVALDPAAVIAEARVPIGSNLFLTLLSHSIDRRVGNDPQIALVSAGPLLPHTVVIHIVERQPYAVLAAGNRRWILDADGVPCREVPGPVVGLPVLAYAGAFPPAGPVLGKPINEDWLKQAYKLIALVKDNKNLAIEKITVDQSANLCLNRQDNLQIKLGQADSLPFKLAIAQASLSADNGALARQAAYIDVTCPEQPVWLPRSVDRIGKNEDGTLSGVTGR